MLFSLLDLNGIILHLHDKLFIINCFLIVEFSACLRITIEILISLFLVLFWAVCWFLLVVIIINFLEFFLVFQTFVDLSSVKWNAFWIFEEFCRIRFLSFFKFLDCRFEFQLGGCQQICVDRIVSIVRRTVKEFSHWLWRYNLYFFWGQSCGFLVSKRLGCSLLVGKRF